MTAPSAVTRTVLLATGARRVRDRFAEALDQAGHHTIEVAGTDELLEVVSRKLRTVDLLLLDLKLGDGPSLVSQVREEASALSILVFSGSVSGALDVRALAAFKVTGYVNEHCDTDRILTALTPHLFPDSFNRRSSPRVVLEVPVSYQADLAIVGALTLNLGRGGLAIRPINPLEISTRVVIQLRLPSSSHAIEAACRVVWRDRRVGMGLQFEHMSASAQTVIDDYVDGQHRSTSNTMEPNRET